MIKYVINNDYMPPWPADTSYSHFLNEKKITNKEKNILFEWINSNNYIENEKINFPKITNKQKVPDLIVHMEEAYKILGNNKDKFLMMKFPFELPHDTFIKKIEFYPGNNKLVHHINAHLIRYDNNNKKDIFSGERVVDTEHVPDSIAFERLDLLNDDGSLPNS